MVITLVLLLIAGILLLASRRRWISSRTLQDLANIAGIVAMLAAIVSFVIPMAPKSRDAPVSTTVATQQPTLDQTSLPSAQVVQWIPDNDGRGTAGLCIKNWEMKSSSPVCLSTNDFVPWNNLRYELEREVLHNVRNVPQGSTLALKNGPQGERNWIIKVVDQTGNEVANIWIGNDPLNSWSYDGLVRVGYPFSPVTVWATFQRYSDGTYREQ
jgi:hypothetical protein